MKKTYEQPSYLFVRINDEGEKRCIETSVVDSVKVANLERAGAIIVKSRQDLEHLRSVYNDVEIERGMRWYPELNSYFSYLLTLLVDENNCPQDVEIAVEISLLIRKESL